MWIDFSIWYKVKVQFQSFAYEDPILTLSFVQETIHSPLCILGTLVKNQSTVCIWIYFWVLHFIYSYVCQYHSCTVLITVTFVLYSKVRKYYTSRFVLLSQGWFDYYGFLCSIWIIDLFFFCFVKNAMEILIVITLKT